MQGDDMIVIALNGTIVEIDEEEIVKKKYNYEWLKY